jgi:serine/threonine protein kinase/Leucine-rich repeat (LRR) protein
MCGAVVVVPWPRLCPACAAPLGTAASANEFRGPTKLEKQVKSNPETVTIQVGHQDSVVYLPDDSPSRAAEVPATVVGPKASLSHVGMKGGVTLEHPSAALERIATGSTTTLPTQKVRSGTGSVAVGGATVDELLTQRPGEEKYVVAGEIARGGMGVILRAVDRDIRRDVAMKILLTDQQDHSRQRFVEEAQIAGQLEHPNIVPVHDLGVDTDGRLFFTMKLVKGKSLAEILDQQRTPAVAAVVQADPTAVPEHGLTRMLGIYLSVLNAIAFAHDRGVIHRDLKPANLMVGDFGEVLVMDWGLAKVSVGRTGSAKQWTHQHVRATNLGQLAAGKGVGRKALVMPDPHRPLATDERLKVLVEGFASQDGEVDGKLIEGTPAYMAPEQARGALSEIDERSDIYSLGAILYELLTLSPPVRGRQVRTILDDVIAGRILAPQSRAPERSIPPELSAIALKALARDKADRYPSVLALRSDIELYLDDRQVSAKEDSTWEALVKLMRRNQEVVTAIIVCVLIVVVVTIFLFNAILKERHKYQQSARVAETRLDALKTEQGRRAADQRRAAPALVAKAKRAVDLKDFPEAQADVDLAIQYDPALPEARLLAAQLAIREQDWTAAAIALSAYVQGKPDDADGKLMLGLVRRAGQPNDDHVHRQVDGPGGERSSERLTAIADALVRQGAYTIAESLYQSGRELMLMYRVRLEKQWPGSTKSGFSADKDGKLTITGLAGRGDVYDLSALEGLPIAYLSLAHTKALDITPLKRMPLISLDLTDTPVRNLEPLAGLPLTVLRLANTRVVDLSSLATLPLEELDLTDTAVADLNALERLPLTTLGIARTRVQDLAVLVGMPLTTLSMAGTRVQDLVPLKGLKLAELDATGTLVADLAPLRGMRLTSLRLAGTRVTDLRPLKGMPLNELTITGTTIADLEPLKGMALTRLDLSSLPVTDLSPLIGMPLTRLDLWRSPLTSIATLQGAQLSVLNLADSRVSDLSPLKGMPLATLDLTNTPVTDLKPLVGTPLTSLILDGTAIADIGPLRLLPLKELRMAGTRITDVRPLSDAQGAGHSLERLILPPKIERGLDGLRRLTSLQRIGERWEGSWDKATAAADFWRLQATGPVRPAP